MVSLNAGWEVHASAPKPYLTIASSDCSWLQHSHVGSLEPDTDKTWNLGHKTFIMAQHLWQERSRETGLDREEAELQCRPNKASFSLAGSGKCKAECTILSWNGWASIPLSCSVTGRGCLRKGVTLGKVALCSWGKPCGANSWKLLRQQGSKPFPEGGIGQHISMSITNAIV